jgi:hypothetical protein
MKPLQVVALPVGVLAGLIAATAVSIFAVIDIVSIDFFKSMASYAFKVFSISCLCVLGVRMLNLLPAYSNVWTTSAAVFSVTKSGFAFVALFSLGAVMLGDPHIRTLREATHRWRRVGWPGKEKRGM